MENCIMTYMLNQLQWPAMSERSERRYTSGLIQNLTDNMIR